MATITNMGTIAVATKAPPGKSAAGPPPGGAPGPGGGPKPGPIAGPPASDTSPSIRLLFKWSRELVSGLWLPFIGISVLGILVNWTALFNAHLVSSLPQQLQNAGVTSGGKAPAASGKGGGESSFDFIGSLTPHTLEGAVIAFALVAVAGIALAYFNRIANMWLNTKMLHRLQLRLHDKLLVLGPRYHAEHDLGENSTLVQQFAGAAQPVLREFLASPVRLITLASALILLFYNLGDQPTHIYWILGALLVTFPLAGFWLSNRLRRPYTAVRQRQSEVSNSLMDSLTSPGEVQLMNAQASRSSTLFERLRLLRKAQLRAAMESELSTQFQAAVPAILQVILVSYAVFGTDSDPTTAISAAIAGFTLVPRAVQPLQEIIQFRSAINSAWPQIEQVGNVLEIEPEVRERGSKTAADLPGYQVALSDVVFRPQPDRTVLNKVGLAFNPDKITAIVGVSGSGKSTILKMIARQFDPNEGKVTIGGVDVTELKLGELRRLVGSVSQFPLYIEAPVRENLRLACPDATDAQMEEACRKADLWASLERISPQDPLGALVPRTAGKGGLAGGERRRLAIARALLADPRVLLLDEPAAGVDAISVTKIAEELRKAAAGRTIVLVEHDVDLIGSVADTICCIVEGQITDVGTPAELMARPSLFKDLVDKRRSYGMSGGDDMEVQASVPVRRIDGPPGGPGKAAIPGQPGGQMAGKPGGPPGGTAGGPPPGAKKAAAKMPMPGQENT